MPNDDFEVKISLHVFTPPAMSPLMMSGLSGDVLEPTLTPDGGEPEATPEPTPTPEPEPTPKKEPEPPPPEDDGTGEE